MSKAKFRHGFSNLLSNALSADRTMPGSRAREGEQRLEGARGRHCSSQRQCSCTRGVLRSDSRNLRAQVLKTREKAWRRRQSMLGEFCFKEKVSWCTGPN